MQNKIDALAYQDLVDKQTSSEENDVIEALIGFGYSRQQATQILQKIDPGIQNTEGRLKAALQLLASA